ncbi:MAG: elongation factor P [Nitrospirae bacterium]|nr:elongation factor P [Candidatus Troglogloeales bacterium]
MIATTDFKSGLKIEVDGDPYEIVDFQHVKPGKGGSFVRTKMRNLKTGNTLERTFRSGEKFELPDVAERQMQFLYAQGEEFHFMDTESYEQLFLTSEQVGLARNFLKENMVAQILFYKGKSIGVSLPNFVELTITETAPGIRGDTATGGTKIAKLETGGEVKVPLYIEEGTLIKIDTRSGEYIERVRY